jgi:hypothetical protein
MITLQLHAPLRVIVVDLEGHARSGREGQLRARRVTEDEGPDPHDIVNREHLLVGVNDECDLAEAVRAQDFEALALVPSCDDAFSTDSNPRRCA